MSSSYWSGKRVLVTGGASFIGSHLVEKLLDLNADVTIVDDLSSGRMENLEKCKDKITFTRANLEYISLSELVAIFRGHDIVFHLAAVHGGRGYIAEHPADTCSNFSIDHHVLEGSSRGGVEKVVFASSACAYPPKLQVKALAGRPLQEQDSDTRNLDKPLSADLEYGFAKLMGEVQLLAFVNQYGLKGASVRFVTVYGPRENETHGIIALIYKAFEKMDPFLVWGSGQQERDFTYVEDIVKGSILAAERVNDGSPVNLGSGRRYKISEVLQRILGIMNWKPRKLVYDTSRPVGPESRVLDISRAKTLLDWEPRFSLEEGLRRTIQWYVETHETKGKIDEKLLLERM